MAKCSEKDCKKISIVYSANYGYLCSEHYSSLKENFETSLKTSDIIDQNIQGNKKGTEDKRVGPRIDYEP